jgi:energy-coupling factor transporter ATP-binding protein EcfA2
MGSQKKILLKKVNTYKKNHSGEYFGDSERSKVKRDKMKLKYGEKMKDFIFIIGPSGVGKSTLSKALFEHYKSTYVEQWMIPEFTTRNGVEEMSGELEELTCWENQVAMLLCFHKLGYKNIIASDIDDLRTGDIPIVFKGYNFITIKLISSNLEQIQNQMKFRSNNGLIDYELQHKMNEKNRTRPLLVNEYEIDVAGLAAVDVFHKAVDIIN